MAMAALAAMAVPAKRLEEVAGLSAPDEDEAIRTARRDHRYHAGMDPGPGGDE